MPFHSTRIADKQIDQQRMSKRDRQIEQQRMRKIDRQIEQVRIEE
jgi:hypothetical protein